MENIYVLLVLEYIGTFIIYHLRFYEMNIEGGEEKRHERRNKN